MTESALPASGRIDTLDTLRGFAVLGILPVNMLLFGWPEVMLFNPAALMTDQALDWTLWAVTHLLFEQKFYSLLSMVFGASLLLFESACIRRGEDPSRRHYRRLLTLGVIGMIHAYGLWFGDILYFYALCGLLAWWMRHFPVVRLLWSGALLMAVPALMLLLVHWSVSLTTASLMTDELAAILWPEAEQLAAEITAYQGNWWAQMPYRATAAAESQSAGFLATGLWKTWGLMLWGMAFWRLGWWEATPSNQRPHRVAIVGLLPLGLTLTACGMVINVQQGFRAETVLLTGQLWNYGGSLLTALGYAALIIRWRAHRNTPRLPALEAVNIRLQAVGRMALTAYLAQTLIATTVFYGHGFGQYGQWHLWQGWLLVIAIWGVLLIAAPRYLARFHSGPMERLWRRLSR